MKTSEAETHRADQADLFSRVVRGEVVVLRNCLQNIGLFDGLLGDCFAGIAESAGQDAADRLKKMGVEQIHELVSAEDFPDLTDAVYDRVTESATEFLQSFIPQVFGNTQPFYFERQPNVRFHLPYDLTAPQRKKYEEFAVARGQGKLGAHGPHRDFWLDCPDNAINLWIAVGPVQIGNGLSIFEAVFDQDLNFTSQGELVANEPPGEPSNYNMQPGDVLLFFASHLHSSEINQTDETRVVVSYRISLKRPNFPHGHYHDYLRSDLASGCLSWLASTPARMQIGYFTDIARRAGRKIGIGTAERPSRSPAAKEENLSAMGTVRIPLSDLSPGKMIPIANNALVAQTASGKYVVTSRKCPHKGADLALGYIRDEQIVCAHHNLAFDASTGQSACREIHQLKHYQCVVDGDELVVSASELP